jgi:hypothetical protein
MEKGDFYCEYCGHKFSSVIALTSGTCPRHPNGANNGISFSYFIEVERF